MQGKMAVTRSHVESRILEITNKLAPAPTPSSTTALAQVSDLPPSYEEATGANKQRGDSVEPGPVTEEGELLFSLEGVQVFNVSGTGEVSTAGPAALLRLVRLGADRDSNLPPAFLQVADWTYPLLPGCPVLRSSPAGFMLPGLGGEPGAAAGLLLPATTPTGLRARLANLLAELTDGAVAEMRTREEVEAEYAEVREFSSGLADGMVRGAELVGRGLVRGAVGGSALLGRGGEAARARLAPATQSRPVDPRLAAGLQAASWASSGACRLSGWLVGRLGAATAALGRQLAPGLERGATRALAHYSGRSSLEASSQLAIAAEVAGGTVAAVSTMYLALENSAKILAKNIANNTVMLVAHSYGPDMAAATDDALSTAGNSYMAVYNMGALGPKGVAKRAVKETAKAAIGVDQEEVDRRARLAPDDTRTVSQILTDKTNKN